MRRQKPALFEHFDVGHAAMLTFAKFTVRPPSHHRPKAGHEEDRELVNLRGGEDACFQARQQGGVHGSTEELNPKAAR